MAKGWMISALKKSSEATTKSISKTIEYEFGECANKSITKLRTEDV